MKKILSILLLTGIVMTACNPTSDRKADKVRFLFDPGTLQFISASLNTERQTDTEQQTMSALYGNPAAITLLLDTGHPRKQISLKLVTYRMQDNPQYFGGKINGQLIRVESLKGDQNGKLSYEIEYGEIPEGQSKAQRIANLLDNEPVKFPQ